MKLGSDRLLLEVRRSLRPFAMLIVLVVIAGTAFAIIARNLTFQRPWKHYNEVRAQFDDVKGIFPGGHQVRIHGVKAGIVSKSALVDGKPVLTLKIEDQFGPVYKDARLQIRPITPLQDLYVNVIDRGHRSAGEATKSWIIPASQTITPVDVSRVLDTFDADTRSRLTILLNELGRGLGDHGVQLRQTFAELAPFLHVAKDATQVLNERRQNVRRLIHNFGSLSGTLAQRDADLNRFVRMGDRTLGELASKDQALAGTITELAALMPVMQSSFGGVERLSNHLDPALVALVPVAKQLKPGLLALEQLGQDATPALQELRPAVTALRTMARTLPSTSASLDTAFQRFSAQVPQVNRLTTTLAPCMSTLQTFFQNTLSVFKYRDVNGSFPRADEVVDIDSGGEFAPPPANLRKLPTCVG
jgi:ABC-type transporter Mla subunit MlaD